jgi:hypothetical protein
MRNFKNFLYFGIFSFFLIYACNKNVESSSVNNNPQSSQLDPGGACYESSQPAGCTPQTKTFAITNVSGYPGCIFNVKVKYC